jgi:hypothetical protein
MSTVPVLGLAFETVLPWVLALVLALVHYLVSCSDPRTY